MDLPTPLQNDTLTHTISILSRAFTQDPIQRYLLLSSPSATALEEIPLAENERVFGELVPQMVEEGAFLVTVFGSGIASVW
jgi:hypothetical protein